MVVLKNIPRILSPELLSVMARMGHGDELILADANFPTAAMCKNGPEMVSGETNLIVRFCHVTPLLKKYLLMY